MSTATPSMARLPASDPAAMLRWHATLRFAVGVTFAFVLSEALNWRPTCLPPVLTGVLLANLPMRPPLKVLLVLVGTMAASAFVVWLVSVLLYDVPTALFVAVAVLLFATFLSLLRGAPALPGMLMMICLATVPIIAMASPADAWLLPEKLIRAMALAAIVTWSVHVLWPRVPPPHRPPPKPRVPEPVLIAMSATMIVLPVMLLYLLYAPTQALPALIATVMLVANFDFTRGRKDAVARVAANAAGGVVGVLANWFLMAAPSLLMLALLTFLLMLAIGALIAEGGPRVYGLVLANNGLLVIFSSAIASGSGDPGLWLTRVAYFALAGLFVVGAMYLVWQRAMPANARPA